MSKIHQRSLMQKYFQHQKSLNKQLQQTTQTFSSSQLSLGKNQPQMANTNKSYGISQQQSQQQPLKLMQQKKSSMNIELQDLNKKILEASIALSKKSSQQNQFHSGFFHSRAQSVAANQVGTPQGQIINQNLIDFPHFFPNVISKSSTKRNKLDEADDNQEPTPSTGTQQKTQFTNKNPQNLSKILKLQEIGQIVSSNSNSNQYGKSLNLTLKNQICTTATTTTHNNNNNQNQQFKESFGSYFSRSRSQNQIKQFKKLQLTNHRNDQQQKQFQQAEQLNDKLGEILNEENKNWTEKEMLCKVNDVIKNNPPPELLINFSKCLQKYENIIAFQANQIKEQNKEIDQQKYKIEKQEFQVQAYEQQLELINQQNEQLQNTLFTQQDRIINYKVKEKRVIILLKELLQLGIDVEEISNSLFNPDGTLKQSEMQIEDDNKVLMKESQDLEMCYKLLKHQPTDKNLRKRVAFERTDLRAENNIIDFSCIKQAADSSILSESKELSFNFMGRDLSETGKSSLMATNYQQKCFMKENNKNNNEKQIPNMKQKLQLNLTEILNKKQKKMEKKMLKQANSEQK